MNREQYANSVYQAGMKKVNETPEPEGQKFPCGARVRISDDFPTGWPWAGRLATVEYTYAHAYWGDNIKDYSLIIHGIGKVSWIHEKYLEAVV